LEKNREIDTTNYIPDTSVKWREDIISTANESFGLIMETAEVIGHWAGLYPGTIDYLPIIEETQPNFFTASGFSGTGLMHAPAVGMIISYLVSFGQTDKIDISVFNRKRFKNDFIISETTGF